MIKEILEFLFLGYGAGIAIGWIPIGLFVVYIIDKYYFKTNEINKALGELGKK